MMLDQELPGLFDELAADHRVGPAPLLGAGEVHLDASHRGRTHHRRASAPRVLAVAACAALVVGGLVVIGNGAGRNGAPGNEPAATQAATDAVIAPAPAPVTLPTMPGDATSAFVLAPAASGPVELVSAYDFDRAGSAAGAVLAPDGTVFSLVVSPRSTWYPELDDWQAIPPERRDIRTLAGREVAAVVDGTAPTQIYRIVRDGCWTVEFMTADEAMWSDDVATLIDALRIAPSVSSPDEAPVTVVVPEGWVSLGGGRMSRSWVMELRVEVDGQMHAVHLAQVPNAPVGFLLSGESNPVSFDHDGRQWWAVDIVTTPGMTSVIGSAGLGAFHITSDLSADELVSIVDSLVATPVSQLDPQHDAVADTIVEADAASGPAAGCGGLGTGIAFDD